MHMPITGVHIPADNQKDNHRQQFQDLFIQLKRLHLQGNKQASIGQALIRFCPIQKLKRKLTTYLAHAKIMMKRNQLLSTL